MYSFTGKYAFSNYYRDYEYNYEYITKACKTNEYSLNEKDKASLERRVASLPANSTEERKNEFREEISKLIL